MPGGVSSAASPTRASLSPRESAYSNSSAYGTRAYSAYIAPPSQTAPSYQNMLAHIREHEYPEYMNFHMMQGMTREGAHAGWHGMREVGWRDGREIWDT